MYSVEDGLCPLVVVDPVRGCCGLEYERPEWGIHFSRVREVVPRLNGFVERHQSLGGRVIWVKPVPWAEGYLPDNINRLYRENPRATFYVTEGVDGYSEFQPGIDVEEGDVVIEKNSYSAFTNPLLTEALGCDSYLVAGFYADGCVNATIVDGWGRGYFTYILGDLVESMDGTAKQEQKRYLLSRGWPLMYGHVVSSGEYLKLVE